MKRIVFCISTAALATGKCFDARRTSQAARHRRPCVRNRDEIIPDFRVIGFDLLGYITGVLTTFAYFAAGPENSSAQRNEEHQRG